MKKSIVAKMRNASAEQEKPLTEVQNKLIVDNIPYAKNVAKSFIGSACKRGITLDQLETEACSALCEAALRFDPEKGADFKTYAFGWCKKYILAYIRDWGYSEHEDIENVQDVIAEDDEEVQEEQRLKVEAMMAVLNDRELKVVRLLYGFGSTSSPQVGCDPKDFKEIAMMMHIRVARVHQIYEKARMKMEFYK